jgi:hypothetical protein
VPGPGNPQALNRYAYTLNNPVKYTDPSGHAPDPSGVAWRRPRFDPQWADRFKAAHSGTYPAEQDWLDYLLSLRVRGTGPNGEWTNQDWRDYSDLRNLVTDDLLRYNSSSGGSIGSYVFGLLGGAGEGAYDVLNRGNGSLSILEWTADDVPILTGGWVPEGADAWTLGEAIFLNADRSQDKAFKNHEYLHILQYRRDNAFVLAYLYALDTEGYSQQMVYENQAYAVMEFYEQHQWLPNLWDLPVARR